MRRLLAAATAATVLGLAGLGLWQAVQPAPVTPEAQVQAIGAALRCPTCQGLSVADSSSRIAASMGDIIAEQIADGRTPEEIQGYFVDRYGDWILLSPPATGLGWLVWALPVLGITGGAAVALTRPRAAAAGVAEADLEHARALEALHREGRLALPQTPAGDRLETALELAVSVAADDRSPTTSTSAPRRSRDMARRRIATALAAQRREQMQSSPAADRVPDPARPAPPSRPTRRMAWAGGVAAFVGVLAALLLYNIAPRGAGDLPSGNLPSAAATSTVGLDAVQTAVDRNPRDIPARLQLAASMLQAGDVEGARLHARTVLDQHRDQPGGLLLLGLAMSVQGDPVAPQTLQRYLDVAPPDHPGIPLARSLLEPRE